MTVTMLRSLILLPLLSLGAFAAPTFAAPTFDDAAEDRADEALDALADGIEEERLEPILGALTAIDEVMADVSERTAAKLVKEVGDVFSDYVPRKDLSNDNRQDVADAYRLAVGVLFDKDGGSDELEKALKLRHVKDWPDVQALILEGLGFSRDPGRVRLFEKHLDSDEPLIVRAAAGALGAYAEAEVDVRRDAVEALIDRLVDLHEEVEKQTKRGRGDEAQELLDRVEVPILDALNALTGRTYDSPDAWTDWFSEQGSEDDW